MKQLSDKAKIWLAIERDKQELRNQVETACIWMGWIILAAGFFYMFVITLAMDSKASM